MLASIKGSDFKFALLNQLWKLLSGPIILIIIPIYLTLGSQGYWYTFISLAGISIIADMGFTSILLLYASHEYSSLSFNEKYEFVGDSESLTRLSSLFFFALKWVLSVSLVVYPVVIYLGYYFLNKRNSLDIEWTAPWFIYCIGVFLTFINTILLAFIQGCDSVGKTQKIRLEISFVNVILMVIMLTSGLSLFSLALSVLFSALFGLGLILRRYLQMYLQMYFIYKKEIYKWNEKVMPLLWRYSISWASGYMIFSLFTPMAFHFYSPTEAGKIGFSLSIALALFGLSNIWVIIITPKINIFVAKREYEKLNNIFIKQLIYSITSFVIISLFFLLITRFDYIDFIMERMVSPFSFNILLLSYLFHLPVNAFAVYMRAHKKEPMMKVTFFHGCIVLISSLLISMYFDVKYMFIGMLCSYLFVLPWVWYIFKNYYRGNVNV